MSSLFGFSILQPNKNITLPSGCVASFVKDLEITSAKESRAPVSITASPWCKKVEAKFLQISSRENFKTKLPAVGLAVLSSCEAHQQVQSHWTKLKLFKDAPHNYDFEGPSLQTCKTWPSNSSPWFRWRGRLEPVWEDQEEARSRWTWPGGRSSSLPAPGGRRHRTGSCDIIAITDGYLDIVAAVIHSLCKGSHDILRFDIW